MLRYQSFRPLNVPKSKLSPLKCAEIKVCRPLKLAKIKRGAHMSLFVERLTTHFQLEKPFEGRCGNKTTKHGNLFVTKKHINVTN